MGAFLVSIGKIARRDHESVYVKNVDIYASPGGGARCDPRGIAQPDDLLAGPHRVAEAEQVMTELARHGLRRGEDGLELYVMCEVPSNVILVDEFAKVFDGFSVGSNDLTQLTLGVDRDSNSTAFDFDERDAGMLEMLRLAGVGAHRNHRHVGICGEAAANDAEIAAFLAGIGIDSISVNPSSPPRAIDVVRQAEQESAPRKATAQ